MSIWKEISKEGDGESWSPEEGDSVEGRLVSIKREVGPNKSDIYEIEKDDKSKVSVWSTTVLRTKMQQVAIDSMVRITFLGSRTSKRGGSYKDFKVETQGPILALANDTEGIFD